MAKTWIGWSPDTCSCVLAFEYDDAEPPETRVHTVIAHPTQHRVCAAHAVAGSPGAWRVNTRAGLHAGAPEPWADNQRKNVSVGHVAEILGIAPDEVPWQFDQTRTLVLGAMGVAKTASPAQLAQLNARLLRDFPGHAFRVVTG